MNAAFWITNFIISSASLVVIGYVLRNRKKITCMTGMMIAMTIGMMVGITAGTMIGIVYSDNLFYSTIIGMLIGGLAGIIAGAPVGVMPIIDGLMSGVMGGMMGAMLGVMIVGSQANTMIRILVLLFVGTILILFYMVIGEIKNGKHPRFIKNPIFVVIFFLLFFFIYNQVGDITSSTRIDMNHQKHHQMEKE